MTLRPDKTALQWPKGLQPPSALQKCLHQRHHARLSRLVHALWDSADPQHRRWAIRLANCCRTAAIAVDVDSGAAKPWLSTCGSRLCPFCGTGRASRLARKLTYHLARMKRPKHLILTMRSREIPLADQLRKLRRSFAKLRRTRVWRDAVAGGIYSIEVTRNQDTGLWHPHLHAVVDAKYMPQPVIAKLWGSFVGDTAHVWIRQVTDAGNMAWELGKYVGKPPDTRGWPMGAILTHADALHGQRMIQSFGNQHGITLPKPDEPPAESPGTDDISIPRIGYLAAQGVDVAQDLAAVVYIRWPMFRTYLEQRWPQVQDVEILRTMPNHILPRAPPGPDGRPGPCRDPAQARELDILTQLLAIHWLNQDEAALVSGDYAYMETGL